MSSKAREALNEILNLAYIAKEDEGRITNEWLINTCRSVLAEPLRNCEVGTPEEQYNRFIYCCTNRKIPCRKSYTNGCTECYAKWSQMPYESEVSDDA